MRRYRLILAALALSLVVPTVLEAQVVYRVQRRGMLGFASEENIANDGTVRRVIVDVVKDSPAEKAGVVVGDTLVRFNGLQPRSELLAAFQPGDTVVLRLRRSGREREVRVVAAERSSPPFAATFEGLPDSIRNHVAVMVDAVRAGIDTVHFPRMRIERLQGDSTIVYFGNDRVLSISGDLLKAPLHLDSIRSFMLRQRPGEWQMSADSGRFHFFNDSVRTQLRVLGDSSRIRVWSSDTVFGASISRFREPGDTTFFEMLTPGRGLAFGRDSLFVRPGEMVMRNFNVGMRAIAGAELFDLNPELGETFGTREGVLVLNASEGTPAAKSGLRGGDVIVSADGQAVTSIQSLRRVIDQARPGAAVRLEVLRRGSRTTVNLTRQ